MIFTAILTRDNLLSPTKGRAPYSLVNAATNEIPTEANALESSLLVKQLNQTLLNQVVVQNPSLPPRQRQQPLTQSQSSPIGRSPRRVSPDLPVAPELVKKTRKRKALVEDNRELVDMGPRKLRSRK